MSEVCEELVAFGIAGVFAGTLGVLWSGRVIRVGELWVVVS